MFAGLSASRPIKWDLDSLIQELMMALVGYTGDIFVDSSKQDPRYTEVAHPDRCTIGLAPDIVLAEDVNKEELLRLVQLSFHYKQIKHFIQQEQHPAAGDQHKSKYRSALCTGIDEVLCLYEDEVVLLQDRLLQWGLAKGLPGITYELADLQRLLVHVHYMVHTLRRRDPLQLAEEEAAGAAASSSSSRAAAVPPGYEHTYPGLGVLEGVSSEGVAPGGLVVRAQFCGARLLHWLHERKAHGDQLLRACTQRLMWHVHQVFFNQLTLWMVHGLLIDSGNEFLIRPSADTAAAGEAAAGEAAAADTDTVRDSSSSSGGGAKPDGPPTDSMDAAVMSEQDTYRDFHSAFVVDNLQLPPGLSTHTASSIEFVGRAVRLLKSAPAAAKLREMQDAWGSYSQQQQQQQGGVMGLGCVGASLPQQLLPYGDAMAYAAALRLLQDQAEYSPGALERTVEAIRADVASRVWQLVVVDSRLTDHLAALKDYLLLGKGDFFQCFLTDAARLLTLPAEKGTKLDSGVAVPWQSAANKSSAADDPHLAFFSILVNKAAAEKDIQQLREKDSSSSSSNVAFAFDDAPLQVADCLRIKAQLPWPLGVLITKQDLERYNKVFALLLKVKRVQLELEAAWQELGRLSGRNGGNTPMRGIGELLQLRQHMGHLIGNLQVYLHLDVIETNYDTLIHKVAAAQDFAEVAAAHEAFLRTVMAQTLLGRTMVTQMHHVFALARQLCVLVKGARDRTRGVDLTAVMAVKREFEPVVQSLCMGMRSKSLKQLDKAPYLTQLYERLNYNGYLGKACSMGLRPAMGRDMGPGQ